MTNAAPDLAPQTIYIQITDEQGMRQVVPLTAAGLMVGAFSGSQIQLSGPGIALNHLWIKYADGQATVRMLSPEHPAWLRDQALTPGKSHPWSLQEPLMVGRYKLILTPTASPPPTQPQPTPGQSLPFSATGATIPQQPATLAPPTPDAGQPLPSTQPASDPVGIELAPGDLRLQITPGKPVNIPVILYNRRSAPEQVQLALGGLLPNEYATTPADIDLAPKARRQVDLRVALAESPETVPGERTITIAARSLTAPDVVSQRQLTWVVRRFVKKPNVQIVPNRRTISSLQTLARRDPDQGLGATYGIQIENLSNEREFYSIRVESGDPSVACSLREANKSIGPGEKGEVTLRVEPLDALDGQRRLTTFKVLVRPDSQPAPEPQIGRLEHVTAAYALRRYAPLALLAGIVLLAFAAAFFILRTPRTPAVAEQPTAPLGTAPRAGDASAAPAPIADLGPLQTAAAQTTTALAQQAQTAQNIDAGVRATQDTFATAAAGTSFALSTSVQATNVLIGTLVADATKGVGNAGATVQAIFQQQTATAVVAAAINQTGTALAVQLAPTQTALAAGQLALAQTQTAQPNPTLTAAAAMQSQVAAAQTAIASFTPAVLPPLSARAKALQIGAVLPNIAAGAPINMTVSVLDDTGRLLPVNDIPIQLTLSSTSSSSTSGAGLGLSGNTGATTVNGIATFSNLLISGAGTYIIKAISPALPTLPAASSSEFLVAPAAPSKLTVTLNSTPPFTITVPLSVTVRLFDQYGNLATNAADNVSVSIFTNNEDKSLIATIPNKILPLSQGAALFDGIAATTHDFGKIYQVKAETILGPAEKHLSSFSANFTFNQFPNNDFSLTPLTVTYTGSDISIVAIAMDARCKQSAAPALIVDPATRKDAGTYQVMVSFPPNHPQCKGSKQLSFTITPISINYTLFWNGITGIPAVLIVAPILPGPSPADFPTAAAFDIQYCPNQPNPTCSTDVPTATGDYYATAKLKSTFTNYTAPNKQTSVVHIP